MIKLTEKQKGYACGLCTGRGFIDLLNPTPEQINIDDMITCLDRTYRWLGTIPFTVNQHQALVFVLVKRWGGNFATQLEALIHDGHEYVTGDLASPFKDRLWMEGPDGDYLCVADVQEKVQKAIRAKLRFTLEQVAAVDFELVGKADLFAREMEWEHWQDEDTANRAGNADYDPLDVEIAHETIGNLAGYDTEGYEYDLANLRAHLK